MIEIKDKSFPSTDGAHRLVGKLYIPDGEAKAIFHLVHGMTDHIARYEGFLVEMAKHGYLCVAFDNLGHGHTAVNDSELGFIAHNNGWKILADDVNSTAELMKKEFPNLHYYLMGHSMGSFIVRLASYLYPSLQDKLIIMGTGGPNPAFKPALFLTNVIKGVCGEKHISPLLEGMAFGSYNKRFKNASGDWLSKNPEIRKAFDADKFCNFHFSVSALRDLVKLNATVNSKTVFSKMRKDLPIFILSGEDDPVGDYGKGVRKVYENMSRYVDDVRLKLYKNNRHELLNDTARNEVISDILDFLN